MATENNQADHADVLSQNAKLTTDLAAANASLVALTGEKATFEAQLKTANDATAKAVSDLAAVTAEREAAKSENAKLIVERDNFKALSEPVQKQLAAELSKHGIRQSAISAAKPEADRKLTATEKAIAARGAK